MVEALGIELKEILFAIVNFLVLVAVLGKFLYRPFLEMLENRKQAIKGAFDSAEATNRRADEKLAAYNKRVADVEAEGREIIKNAKIKAEKQAKDILDEASEKAGNLIVQAEREIEREQAKAIAELKTQVAALSLLVAEKVLEKQIAIEGQDEFINNIIEQAGRSEWQN